MKDIMDAKQEGLSYSEISKKLNIPYRAIKSAFHTARKKDGFHTICLEVPEEISEEEALKRIKKAEIASSIDELWAELEDIYREALET